MVPVRSLRSPDAAVGGAAEVGVVRAQLALGEAERGIVFYL